MDYASHGFWSYIFFNKIRRPMFAILFGLLPDTTSWFIYSVYRFIFQGNFGKPVLSEIPSWAYTLYNMSHSLVVSFGIIILTTIFLRRIPIYMLAWPLAIVMDLFTHTRDFLPTPFLWPVSDWKFPGISWGNKWFFAINYFLITVMMVIILKGRRKKIVSRDGSQI